MHKFIFPLSESIGRRLTARRRFERMQAEYDVEPQRTRLREETFLTDSIFRDLDTGRTFTQTNRVYTFTFFLPEDEAKRFIAVLCSTSFRRLRLLTRTSTLLLLDDVGPVEVVVADVPGACDAPCPAGCGRE